MKSNLQRKGNRMHKFLLFIAALGASPLSAQGQDDISLSQRTMDALVHVVAHEVGHAFLREFDLPILGPEEAIADDFATVYVYLIFPERAEAIVVARADQNLADGQEMRLFSEYMDDDQRAGRSICLLYGLDPERFGDLPDRYGMTDSDASVCRDFGPEVGRHWRRLIAEYRMPDGARITEVRLTGDDLPLTRFIAESPLADDAYALLSTIDWHSQISLSIEACDIGSGFSRNGRQITICDSYVERFERQLGN
ncbi:MAG: DUF4344 domain-containing metallopeptidase [Marinosulfonomonas sp.]